jgi:hypothetical protein
MCILVLVSVACRASQTRLNPGVSVLHRSYMEIWRYKLRRLSVSTTNNIQVFDNGVKCCKLSHKKERVMSKHTVSNQNGNTSYDC